MPADAKTAIEAAGKQLASLRQRLGVTPPGQGDGGGPGGGGGGGGRGGGGGGGRGGGGAGDPNVRGALGQTKGQIMNSQSVPTEQQTRALAQGREDLMRAIADANTLITTMPGLFDKIGASAFKPAAVKPVRTVTSTQ
jgi:hypothetical protein